MDNPLPLPEGTVTLLFTDIEGSTRLLQRLGERYAVVLADHQRLLRAAFGPWGGSEIDTAGDGFFVVFPRAADALAAAIAAQQALGAHAWAGEETVRVRMGLHTGEPLRTESGYVGLDVHRAARLAAAGHGGQILLTQATYELVRDGPPAGAILRDLGAHRLKDLQRPEQVYQLLHPDLPADLPPLKSLDAYAHNLPLQLTRFIGREAEMVEVERLLDNTRLLTLTGSGGCGKTRLALQVAANMVEEYPDGVWLVELAALSDPGLVAQAVATALGVREEPGRALADTLTAFLQPKSLLLVLDNCEHLVAACAEMADALMRRCAHLRILASSREALDTTGEMTYRVPSLSLPDRGPLPPIERLAQFEAVRLFVERALFVQPHFALTAQNAPSVARICHQLDGIPLAIELAAARVKVLSAEQIATRLHDRFRLLTGGSRTALKRHQTLQALIDWSYDLLTVAERKLLLRLSVFAGGWTLEAAEMVCAGGEVEEWDVLNLLTELVTKSLVISEEWGGAARYHLLQTVRQYAWERLEEGGDAAAMRSRHRDFFLQLAEEAEPQLRGKEQQAWLQRLEWEHDNLRAAITWSEEQGEAEAGLCLGAALWYFWSVHGHLREGRDRLDAALALPAACGCDLPRARALNGAGALADDQGDYACAAQYHEESLAIARACNDAETMAYALFSRGNLAIRRQQYEQAIALYEQALTLWRAVGAQNRIAIVLGNLAWAVQCLGRLEEAAQQHEESLALNRQLGNQIAVANTLNNLGGLAIDQGEYERAAPLLAESLGILYQYDNYFGIARAFNNIAHLAARQDHLEQAARLLTQVKALCDATGAALPEDYNENVAFVRAAIGEEGFAAAQREGQAMSLDRVIACAMDLVQGPAIDEGEYERAGPLLAESLGILYRCNNTYGVTVVLNNIAHLAIQQGQLTQAARFLAEVKVLCDATGAALPEDFEENLGSLRAAIGEEGLAAGERQAQVLTLEQVVAEAMEIGRPQ